MPVEKGRFPGKTNNKKIAIPLLTSVYKVMIVDHIKAENYVGKHDVQFIRE